MFKITNNFIELIAINFHSNAFKFFSITLNSIYNLIIYIEYAIAIFFEWISMHLKNIYKVKWNLNEIINYLNIKEFIITFSIIKKWISNI